MGTLTDAKIRSIEYQGGVHKVRDGDGLYLHVMRSGKYFRYDYRFQSKRKTLTLGTYPKVTLKQARFGLHEAKILLDKGIDPSYQKQVNKQVSSDHSFAAITNDWLKVQDWSDSHRRTIRLRIDKDLTPVIGDMRVQDIKATDVLNVLRRIESRGSIKTAHRVKTVASQIMRYAVACGLIDSDPCRDLRGALKTAGSKRYAAIVKPKPFGKLLGALELYDNSVIVRHALRLLPHVVLRSGELRGGLWSEIDFKNRLWEIPADRMKRPRDHFVPLTDQSIAILREVEEYSAGKELIFPSLRSEGRPISGNTLNVALKYLGYPGDVHTPHGFRSTFSTMAYESELFNDDVIEMQLAHQDKNRVKGAYKRGEHLKQRRELMEWWSDRITQLRQKQSTAQ